jgi:hypothetical protein
VSSDVHTWVDNLENVSPDQKDRLKEYPEEVLLYAKKSFQETSSIAFPFKWLNKVCENYQTRRPSKPKPKQPHELTGKAKIWAEYDYDLPPTVTPYASFEESEKKWNDWTASGRGQNYRVLYGDVTVAKAKEKYDARAEEWHLDPEGCTRVINDFQKKAKAYTQEQTMAEPIKLVRDQAASYFKALHLTTQPVIEKPNIEGDERIDEIASGNPFYQESLDLVEV